VGWSLIVIFPLFWMVTTSIKARADVFTPGAIMPWLQFDPTFDHWGRVATDPDRTLRSLFNSAAAGVSSALAATALGGMAGYALSRFRYKLGFIRNRDILFWLLSNRILPPIVLVFPLFILFRNLGLVDSRLGLAVLYTAFNLPIAAWLMHEYFRQVPIDLDEAALVDGASPWKVFRWIAFPLARPGLIATFLVCLMFAWNEFIYALVFTFSEAQTMPLLVAGQATQHGPQWWDISVMGTITIAPLALVAIVLGNRMVSGLTSGWSQ
jgi:multiple sugar transport system permease protein